MEIQNHHKSDPSDNVLNLVNEEIKGLTDLMMAHIQRVDSSIVQEVKRNDERHHSLAKELHERRIDLRNEMIVDFNEVREATRFAFESQEKSINSSLLAAKEAVLKAENASEKRFESINEFRNTLRDQQANLLPRIEADKIFENLYRQVDNITKDVSSLRESRSVLSGRFSSEDKTEQRSEWSTGVAFATVLGFLSLVISIVAIFFHK